MSLKRKQYATFAELVADVFDPYLELIPGTRERRAELVHLTQLVAAHPGATKSRKRIERCKWITFAQIGLVAKHLETRA